MMEMAGGEFRAAVLAGDAFDGPVTVTGNAYLRDCTGLVSA